MERQRSASDWAADASRRVVAVLGPTNTGKTHLAIERMLGHRTGMIGFPLRLLARENYDRIARAKGAATVALITGEERIMPPQPRWYVCTVEAMPLERPVEFLAVDEVQLAADPERGHIFTDRLLRARGLSETMLLGAETIKPLIRRLVPHAEFITRPRLSELSYTGPKKLTRLPRRSAVVAFSAAEVYATAELVRRSRGGCAVVLGALSPRARNAQVDLYQSGEVDYLIATDAIGMGLNMDLDHVAFARLTKFDGGGPRRLTAPEVAQIAGRAGRHMNDGTFGTTGQLGALEPELVAAVEAHSFEPLTAVYWRNAHLDFRGIGALLRSLEAAPPWRELRRKRDAEDHQALAALGRQSDIATRAGGGGDPLRLLWDVCQIPDFRKVLSDAHLRLLAQIFLHLSGPGRRLPTDWVAEQIARIDRTEGDIDALSARIAHIRTWTYVSHRADWLSDSAHWQQRTREVEDRLSDALHDRLTQRFVDRRGTALIKRLKDPAELLAGVARDGTVVVEGHPVGRLDGFDFRPDAETDGEGQRRLMAAARRALESEIGRRVQRLVSAPDDALHLTATGQVVWSSEGDADCAVARLAAGAGPLTPEIELLPAELVPAEARERIRRHLAAWLRRHLAARLPALPALRDMTVAGPARGLAYQLGEAMGTLPVAAVESQLRALGGADRRALGRVGCRFGTETVYVAALLEPEAVALRGLLFAVHAGLRPLPEAPAGPTQHCGPGVPAAFYEAAGYRVLHGHAVRADRLEQVAARLRRLARGGPFVLTAEAALDLAGRLGCAIEALPALLAAQGYRTAPGEGGLHCTARRRARVKAVPRPVPPDGPFAALRALRVAT